jgi:ribosomal-protein-alanine N-acetyltransferase
VKTAVPAQPVAHLRPGGHVPGWVQSLDRSCFGTPWGPLEEDEHIWSVDTRAFARWRVVAHIGEAELLRLAVAPNSRRSGLGRALLRHSAMALGRMGVHVFFLEVRVSNHGARALYEAEGWVYQGDREHYYRDGEDAAIYRLET